MYEILTHRFSSPEIMCNSIVHSQFREFYHKSNIPEIVVTCHKNSMRCNPLCLFYILWETCWNYRFYTHYLMPPVLVNDNRIVSVVVYFSLKQCLRGKLHFWNQISLNIQLITIITVWAISSVSLFKVRYRCNDMHPTWSITETGMLLFLNLLLRSDNWYLCVLIPS